MAQADDNAALNAEAGERLEALVRALGYEAHAPLAELAGRNEDTVGTWLSGKVTPPPWFLRRLGLKHDVKGITAFVYEGDPGLLPYHLAQRILDSAEALPA